MQSLERMQRSKPTLALHTLTVNYTKPKIQNKLPKIKNRGKPKQRLDLNLSEYRSTRSVLDVTNSKRIHGNWLNETYQLLKNVHTSEQQFLRSRFFGKQRVDCVSQDQKPRRLSEKLMRVETATKEQQLDLLDKK